MTTDLNTVRDVLVHLGIAHRIESAFDVFEWIEVARSIEEEASDGIRCLILNTDRGIPDVWNSLVT